MKRLHVMLKVKNLEESIEFYRALLGSGPTVEKEDYAKWMLEDPLVNFSISDRSGPEGIEHLGIQAETEEELDSLREDIGYVTESADEEGETVCCYARSDKTWITDPQGVEWELFHTHGESASYYDREEACC